MRASAIQRAVITATVAATLVGCVRSGVADARREAGPALDQTEVATLGADLAELRAQHEAERERLDAIRAEIAEAEARADAARDEAARQECLATIERLEARVQQQHAMCWHEEARSARCEAANAEQRANGTLWGCGIGIGLAFITGGAAAPMALAGCGVGNVIASETGQICSPVTCLGETMSHDDAARALGLDEVPMCGGWVGIVAQTEERVATGLPLMTIGPGSTASAAGLRIGDVLIAVDGRVTPSVDALSVLVNAAVPGHPVAVTVVRNGLAITTQARLLAIDHLGSPATRALLGVVLGAPRSVSFEAGARIVSLSETRAATMPLLVGDVVLAIGSTGVSSEPSLRDALRTIPAGQPLTFLVERGGVRLEVAVTPDQRRARHGI